MKYDQSKSSFVPLKIAKSADDRGPDRLHELWVPVLWSRLDT